MSLAHIISSSCFNCCKSNNRRKHQDLTVLVAGKKDRFTNLPRHRLITELFTRETRKQDSNIIIRDMVNIIITDTGTLVDLLVSIISPQLLEAVIIVHP